MTLREKVTLVLKEVNNIPFAYQDIMNPPDTYITYYEYDYEYEHSDDEVSVREYIIQVDLWTTNPKYKNIENKIKQEMKNQDFVLDSEEDLYEKDTKIYHKALRFYIENLKEVE